MDNSVNSYCNYVVVKNDVLHKNYHDNEYGFPVTNDNELFKRLMLEVNQAGLSWNVILKKKLGMLVAYNNFDIETVANYTERDRERLLSDPRIIRNKLKVNAAIYNAQQILKIQQEFGSFKKWLDINFPKSKENWVKLFKKNFKFTGGEITKEFLQGCGYLKGAHEPSCPIYKKILAFNPKWIQAETN